MEVFLILLLCVVNAQAQVTAEISPDEDYNAALDPNSRILFNCTGNGNTIGWIVDGSQASDADIISRGVTTTGAMEISEGVLLSTLSIPASEQNDNSSIRCSVLELDSNGVPTDFAVTELIYLNIQGILGPPPNLILSDVDEQLSRLLTWDPPDTLDITNVDPDIDLYQVCYNLSTELTCTNVSSVGEREFKFSNVRVPLLFTVTAFNVVGEGNESSIVHEASNCDNVGVPSNISVVQSQISLTQSGPLAAIFFNQSRESPGMCFCVYEVRTNTTEHGPLIPVVDSFSSNSVQLSLNIDSGLAENELYSANITTTNNNGMEITVGTVEFSTYDVQSVNITALPGGLELSCTFVSGSQAQSCLLTVCRVENVSSCIPNTTITRNGGSLTFAEQVTNLPSGMYTIRQVAEVERDGEVTVVSGIDVGEAVNVIDVPTTSSTPSSPPETPPTEGVSSPNSNAGAIAGGVTVGILVIVATPTGAVLVILLYRRRRKKKPLASGRLSTVHLLNETDGGKQNSLPKNNGSEKELAALGPTYATVDSARTTENAIPAKNNHTPQGNGQQETDVKPEDSPTYPLYTEMMGNKEKPSPRDDASPQLPERLLSSEELEKLDLTMEDQVPEVPQQNLTEEDFKEMNLSKASNVPAPDSDSSAPKLKTSELQSSNESLLSQGSKVPGATPVGDGPLYAELEHRKDKKISITAPDMTGVLYSEIKTDEIPPRLPKKKSRSSTNHSTSSPMRASNDSLTESVFTSTPVGTPLNTVQLENLDSYKV